MTHTEQVTRNVNRIKRNTGRPWRRVRDQVYSEEYLCARCGQPVDQTLPYNHDYARSVGHIIPPNLGGTDERHNLRLEHRICNSMGRHTPAVVTPRYDWDGEDVPPDEPRSRIW